MKNKILEDLANHSKLRLSEDLAIEINVEVSIKEYTIKRTEEKSFWYENQ